MPSHSFRCYGVLVMTMLNVVRWMVSTPRRPMVQRHHVVSSGSPNLCHSRSGGMWDVLNTSAALTFNKPMYIVKSDDVAALL
nr:hypothetical protein [Candidatus Sigynarchaeum springense]